MKVIAKVLILGLSFFLIGCIIDPDTDEEGDWEYIYLVTCNDSLADCKVDLRYVDADGRIFMNSVSLPWSENVFILDRDDETISPELEIMTDGGDYGIKAVIVTEFSKKGNTRLERFPRITKYNNMKSSEIYDLFSDLARSLEYNIISAENKKKLNYIVDAFLEADYKYSGTMGEGVKYLKICE